LNGEMVNDGKPLHSQEPQRIGTDVRGVRGEISTRVMGAYVAHEGEDASYQQLEKGSWIWDCFEMPRGLPRGFLLGRDEKFSKAVF
jgi:hypothetical protein